MAVHIKDKSSSNPRLQCSVCGKWKRLLGKGGVQRFYGGCEYDKEGGGHLVSEGEVCNECHERECPKLVKSLLAKID